MLLIRGCVQGVVGEKLREIKDEGQTDKTFDMLQLVILLRLKLRRGREIDENMLVLYCQ
jgi:hypothetical protein